MRISRFFHAGSLTLNEPLILQGNAAKYLLQVLRLKVNDPLILFNGKGGEYTGHLQNIQKKTVIIQLNEHHDREIESPLFTHLGQGISRHDKMDLTIQKAVELGINEITPLITQRCSVKLNDERAAKRQQRWQKIAESACEQCGRNQIPRINAPLPIEQWLKQTSTQMNFVLSPIAKNSLADFHIKKPQSLSLLIGPEGGLTETEISLAEENNFAAISLGPRILRTETAAMVTLSIVQSYWGDLT